MNRHIAGLLLIALSFPALAEDGVIGNVKTVFGTVTVVHAGKKIEAQPGTPIYMADTLKTGAGSTLGVTFKDNTVMSFGPGTEVVVDEYVYEPGKDQLKLGASIMRGTLDYVSGVIAKLKPEAVAIKTPSGTIGVRGTHFMVKVDAPAGTAN